MFDFIGSVVALLPKRYKTGAKNSEWVWFELTKHQMLSFIQPPFTDQLLYVNCSITELSKS